MEKKILIAEDELIIAMNLKQIVQKEGYDVCHISKSGRDMIKSALEIKPDLLMVDIYLNDDIDGIDAVSEIQKIEPIPVIYMTASTDPRTLKKAQQTAMVDYLRKPYSSNSVLHSIHSVM